MMIRLLLLLMIMIMMIIIIIIIIILRVQFVQIVRLPTDKQWAVTLLALHHLILTLRIHSPFDLLAPLVNSATHFRYWVAFDRGRKSTEGKVVCEV